jgi:hypothetical protein
MSPHSVNQTVTLLSELTRTVLNASFNKQRLVIVQDFEVIFSHSSPAPLKSYYQVLFFLLVESCLRAHLRYSTKLPLSAPRSTVVYGTENCLAACQMVSFLHLISLAARRKNSSFHVRLWSNLLLVIP